jgi:hypothetical protein
MWAGVAVGTATTGDSFTGPGDTVSIFVELTLVNSLGGVAADSGFSIFDETSDDFFGVESASGTATLAGSDSAVACGLTGTTGVWACLLFNGSMVRTSPVRLETV